MSKHGVLGRCPVWTGVGSWGPGLATATAMAFAHAGPAAALSLPNLPSFAVTGPAAPMAATPSQPLDCLADAIYYEAGGEPRPGREAVAQVVLNRLHDPAFPKTVCGVVFQGSGRRTGCQFTFTCNGAMGRRPDPAGWRDAQAIAGEALAGRLVSAVGPSTHYHALWVQPAWRLAMTPTLRIGGHQFYRSGAATAGDDGGSPQDGAAMRQAPPRPAAFDVWGLQVATVTPAADGGAYIGAR